MNIAFMESVQLDAYLKISPTLPTANQIDEAHGSDAFLYYSNFYLPMYHSGHCEAACTTNQLPVAICDEAAHGYYIEYKFEKFMEEAFAKA